MSRNQRVIVAAAAAFVSAALILPTSGVVAQGWTTVTHNHMPIVEGSGRIVQQNRAVGGFQRVETFGAEQVDVRLGERESLVISADDNVLPLLTTEVKDGKLKIATRGSFRTRSPIRVQLTTPSLEAFSSYGSGTVHINGVNNSSLGLNIYGSGNMQATGSTRHLNVKIHGSGSARLAGLNSADARVAMFGSGDAIVRTNGELDAQIFGSGTVRYVGSPANIRTAHFGSGRVITAR